MTDIERLEAHLKHLKNQRKILVEAMVVAAQSLYASENSDKALDGILLAIDKVNDMRAFDADYNDLDTNWIYKALHERGLMKDGKLTCDSTPK